MEVQFRNDGFRRYLILRKNKAEADDFALKMLTHLRGEVLLDLDIYAADDEMEYWYCVSGMISLKEQTGEKLLDGKALRTLYDSLLSAVSEARDHLLSPDHLLLFQETVCFAPALGKYRFGCLPVEGDFAGGLKSLTEYCMKYTDHKEQEAVMFIYGLYQLMQEDTADYEAVESYIRDYVKAGESVLPREPSAIPRELGLPKMDFEEAKPPEGYRTAPAVCQSAMYPAKPTPMLPPTTPAPDVATKNPSGSSGGSSAGITGKIPQVFFLPGAVACGCLMLFLLLRGLVFSGSVNNIRGGIFLGICGAVLVYMHIRWQGEEKLRAQSADSRDADRWDPMSKFPVSRNPVSQVVPSSSGPGPEAPSPSAMQSYVRHDSGLHASDSNEFGGHAHVTCDSTPPSVPISVDVKPTYLPTEVLTDLTGFGKTSPEELHSEEREARWMLEPQSKSMEGIFLNRMPCVLGRKQGEVDHVVSGSHISRRHLLLYRNGEEIYAEDLSSTNGTRINGVKLKEKEPRLLREGDQLLLGGETFYLRKHAG